MGWISDRHMKSGGSIGGNTAKTREAARYPLRKIVAVLQIQTRRCRKCPPRDSEQTGLAEPKKTPS